MKNLTFGQRLIIIIVFIAAVFVSIPIAKASGPVFIQEGDLVVVNSGVDLKDFNDSSTSVFFKPTTCHPLDGEVFQVDSINGSLLGLSSISRNCEGGVLKNNIKKH